MSSSSGQLPSHAGPGRHEGLLKSPFSLTEVRVLYELAHRDKPTASALGRELDLDDGYLSRIMSSFEKRGLIQREVSEADGQQSPLQLTEPGHEAFAPLDTRARDEHRSTPSRAGESLR